MLNAVILLRNSANEIKAVATHFTQSLNIYLLFIFKLIMIITRLDRDGHGVNKFCIEKLSSQINELRYIYHDYTIIQIGNH